MPPIPPTKDDKAATTITGALNGAGRLKRRNKGATFCQVVKIRQFNQGIPLITLGSQK